MVYGGWAGVQAGLANGRRGGGGGGGEGGLPLNEKFLNSIKIYMKFP